MFQIIVCILIGICSVFAFRKLNGWRLRKGKVIPGPKGLPIVGCVHKIRADNIHFKFTEYAQEFGEIFQLQMLVDNIIVLNTENLIRKAFGDDTYKKVFNDRKQLFYGEHFRRGNKSLGMTCDGAGMERKLAKKEFTRVLHTYGSGLQELENNVMTELELLNKRIEKMQNNEFNCHELFRRSLSNIISLILSGDVIDDEDPDVNMMWQHVQGADFFSNSKVNLVMKKLPFLRYLPGQFRDEYEKCKLAHGKILRRYFYDIRKSHVPGEIRGLVDHYLEVQREEKEDGKEIFFTDDRIIAQIIETIDAGIATTWAFLTSSILMWCSFPEYQKKIQAELDRVIGRNRLPLYTDREDCVFLKAFGMEMHRFCTVAPLLLPHYCRKEIEFEGYHIQPNSLVIANVWYLHHNEKIWGDPWTFRPERFLDESGNILPNDHKLMKSFMPFSYGPRQCPGAMFAKTRYFLYFATLLQRWDFTFPDGGKRGCDPQNPDHFDLRLILKAKPFICRATERV